MPEALAAQFRDRLAAADSRVARVSEDLASQPWRPGGWLRKEVLGHLLDSAANNHVRFACAATDGAWAGPRYNQPGWVRLHAYARVPWQELVDRWRRANGILAQLVTEIPEGAIEAPCRIAGNEPQTLRLLILDYLDHLEHHVTQIMSGLE
jgi:hypothetical protein